LPPQQQQQQQQQQQTTTTKITMTITTTTLIAQRMRRNTPLSPRSPRILGSPASPGTSDVGTPPSRGNMTGRILLSSPNAANINMQMHRSVNMLNESFRPTNTTKCHGPKIDEFFEFCDIIYSHDPYKYNLTDEKVFRFLFYCAFRKQKKRGGRKGGSGPKFDVEGYREVMAMYNGEPCSPGATPLPSQPRTPMSWSSWDQYRQVIAKIYNVQKMEKVCSLYWEDLFQQPCKDLSKHVKQRVPFIKKATYQEKVAAEFAPYTIVERYPEIEEELWKDCMAAVGPRQIACQLRHRYCAQHTCSGILRAESLYRAEISDFLMINPPKTETDVHTVQIMINQVAQGKTNHGRLLYGRAIRHKDVRLCAVGSLSMYLMYRLHVTKEFQHMSVDDWFDNSVWFDIKLLADTNAGDRTKEMGKDSYGDHIQKVLMRLGLPMNKLLHLGRNIGARILELLDEEDEAIRKMGQWNPSVYDNSYSAKLPMGPMRKLAGYHSNNKLYFNTRTGVEPPDVLLQSTPLGWVYAVHDAMMADSRIHEHPTAMFVIRFLVQMNRIFVQDMTAMAALHSDRMQHPMFTEFPIFQSSQWLVSRSWPIAFWLSVF
jgi:Centromere DNA-binding protein complex CBF3 subunit, domain 2